MTSSLIQVGIPEILSEQLELTEPFYFIILMEQELHFSIDLVPYQSAAKSILFLSPFQMFSVKEKLAEHTKVLKFHGDFYCIEYHKDEVACNGLLFNNIYLQPHVALTQEAFQEITAIIDKIDHLKYSSASFDQAITKTYLQLILAIASKQKILNNKLSLPTTSRKDPIDGFEQLLENKYKTHKSVSFYAEYYNLSSAAFTKKVKQKWGKSPSTLIQERIVLESKRLLHLTPKSIKEIAAELQYLDEFYFSRFFKKMIGVSPKVFREQVGLSIVAKKSML
ncbi:helix-turn-helix domain-containing protein [Sphingobacterium detergens]|uniref:helix-turn-helix domain-containing protein n=1 Tax=Sphingobacterium detergens TaxID=1145106 RepID=UPI003AAC46AE